MHIPQHVRIRIKGGQEVETYSGCIVKRNFCHRKIHLKPVSKYTTKRVQIYLRAQACINQGDSMAQSMKMYYPSTITKVKVRFHEHL